MKKLILFLALACVLVFGSTVLATGRDLWDGTEVFYGELGTYLDNDQGFDRYKTGGPDWNNGDQSTEVELAMRALLPCHLEMTFEGNGINTTLESWGYEAQVATGPGGLEPLIFNPDYSGYMLDWDPIIPSDSNNYEIEPGPGVYIRGCDTFRSEVWSNLNYKYTVSVPGGGLTGNPLDPDLVLPVSMRAAVFAGTPDPGFSGLVAGDWTVAHDFSSDEDIDLVNGIPDNFLTTAVVYHEFRVPYDRIYPSGEYTGAITFTAATI